MTAGPVTVAQAQAQPQIVLPFDAGVIVTASPTTHLQPGEPIGMTLSVTNYGPADLPILVLSSSIFVDEMYALSTNPTERYYLALLVIDLANVTTEYDLDWNVAGLGGVLPLMPAGLALTCHFQIALTRSAPPAYSFSFGLPSGYETDPNPSNDRASAPPPTPLPTLSITMLCLLARLAAGFAADALRRHRRERPSRR